mmetsp:Transcript_16322/g.35953  ORF Transcript_16322/g.35953 Transcript_16322/m.35953 type:complete len:250 (-) Transcript_16322:15-764(-)
MASRRTGIISSTSSASSWIFATEHQKVVKFCAFMLGATSGSNSCIGAKSGAMSSTFSLPHDHMSDARVCGSGTSRLSANLIASISSSLAPSCGSLRSAHRCRIAAADFKSVCPLGSSTETSPGSEALKMVFPNSSCTKAVTVSMSSSGDFSMPFSLSDDLRSFGIARSSISSGSSAAQSSLTAKSVSAALAVRLVEGHGLLLAKTTVAKHESPSSVLAQLISIIAPKTCRTGLFRSGAHGRCLLLSISA